MLESIAATLLAKYLGDYVEGLDANNLQLNLSAGDAVLTNLKFKKSALESLELPVTIKNGFLGRLTLQIPWSSLGSKAAIIKIDGVYLVAGPKTQINNSAEEEKTRSQQVKQQRLQLAELLGMDKPEQQSDKANDKEKKKDDGFFSRMAMKVVDNVQIFLDNIHIRYEDDVSNPGNPFAFGITLDSLHAQSCDGQWQPAFLTVGADVIHKLVTLQNLSIYLNTTPKGNAQFVASESAQEMSDALQKLIPSHAGADSQPDHHYVLRPVSGVLKATLDRGELVLTRPRLQLDAELQQLAIALTSSQFQRVQDVLEHFSLYVRSLDYMDYRPPANVRPTDNPKAWWAFVLKSVRADITKKHKTWTWDYIQARSKDRTTYMELHEKKLTITEAKLSVDEKTTLSNLEAKLDYTDIITFRQLAFASWQRKQNVAKEQKSNSGWFSGWFSSNKPAEKDDKAKQVDEEAAMKEIYAAIGYTGQVEKEAIFPKDYVKTAVNFQITQSSFQLRQDDLADHARLTPGVKPPASPIFLSFAQQGFHVSLLMREGNMSVVSTLDTVKMTDYHTLEGRELIMLQPEFANTSSLLIGGPPVAADDTAVNRPKFVAINFDMNPLDAPNIDIRLGLKVQPVSSTLSRALIDRIIQFFERKATRAQLVELSSAAASTWDDLRNRAQTTLKYTYEKRQKIKIDVELAAPRFTIPKNFVDPLCPAVVIDLGTISFKSDPESRSRAISGSSADAKVTEDYFYDRFDIALLGMGAMVVGGREAPWADLSKVDQAKYSVIRKFDLDVILKACSAPSPDLPQIKISGSLKRLALDVTDYRITWILDVLEAVGKSTLPPPVLTEAEKAAARLLLVEMKREEERKAKLAAERAAVEASLQAAPSSDIPTASMVHRPRKRNVAEIGGTSGTSGALSPSSSSSDLKTASPAAPDVKTVDPNILQKKLHVDFTLTELEVTLHKSVPSPDDSQEVITAPRTTSLITLSLRDLSVLFAQTNHWMDVGLRLGALVVIDNFTPGAPNLLEAGNLIQGVSASQILDLVELKYRNIPRTSFAFDKVEHDVSAKFGTMKINVNRVTIACLMQVGNDFAHSLGQNKTPAAESSPGSESPPKSESPAPGTESEAAATEAASEVVPVAPARRPDISLAKLDVSLGALILVLQKENTPFLQFDIAKSHVGVDVRDDGVLHVRGFVGGISLLNCNPGVHWSDMVSITGEKVLLSFQFSKYNRESATTYPGHDINLRANMERVKLVVVYAAIQELIVYFGAFDKMREAIELTTSYYYNASLRAVRSAAEAATKVSFMFIVNNPTIVVPGSSKDSRHVVLDLGKISVSNKWERLPTGVELDIMEASIVGLNLRALTDPNASEAVRNIRVVKESDISAKFKRPLSGNDSFTSPPVDLEVNVAAIDLAVTEDHLAITFAILADNLGEAPARPDSIELDKIVEFLSRFSYNMESWEQARRKQIAERDGQKSTAVVPANAYLNMAVKAYLQQVSLTVFKGSGENSNTKQSTALAVFCIEDLAADYTAFSDSRMKVAVTLGAVRLEDKRVYSENKFRQIWTPNQGVGAAGNRMSLIDPTAALALRPQFSLDYSMEPADNFMSVKLELFRPRLYVVPNVVAELYEFAMDNTERMTKSLAQLKASMEASSRASARNDKGSAENNAIARSESSNQLASPSKSTSSALLTKSPSSASTKDIRVSDKSNSATADIVKRLSSATNTKKDGASSSEAAEAVVSTLRVTVHLISPEICVMENSDKVDTTALVLHLGESKVNFLMTTDGQQKLDLGMDHLDAYKCILDAGKSGMSHDIVKLLQPITLGVNMGVSADKIRRTAIEVGLLQTIISYNDIKLFLDIYQAYTPMLEAFTKPRGQPAETTSPQAATTEAVAEIATNAETFQNAALPSTEQAKSEVKKANKSDKKAAKNGTAATSSSDPDADLIDLDRSSQTQHFIISVEKIHLSLLNDRESTEYSTPVAESSLESVKLITSMYDGGGLEALVTLSTLELKAYNIALAAFEPVIEPWSCEVNFLKQGDASMGLHLASSEMMDINITKSLLDTTFGLLKLAEDFKTGDKKDSDSESASQSSAATGKNKSRGKAQRKGGRVSFNPYVVRNETSVPIRVQISKKADDQSPSLVEEGKPNVLSLGPGMEAPLALRVDRQQAAQKVIRPEIDVIFPTNDDYLPLGRIPVSRIATYSYPVSSLDPSVVLVADITFEQGRKIITLRGNRLIVNDTDTDLEVEVIGHNSQVQGTLLAPANGHLSFPIPLSNYRSLRFRPQKSSYNWYEWKRGDEELSKSRMLARKARKGGPAEGSRTGIFMCVDEAKDSSWVCIAKETAKNTEGDTTSASNRNPHSSHDFVITLSPALCLENATCAELSAMVVNADSGEFHVIAPQEMAKASSNEFQVLNGVSGLQQGLSGLALSVKLPGFGWSDPVRFADRARWIPLKGGKKLPEPLSLILQDEIEHRSLTLFADVKVEECGTAHIAIYANYWLINQTGLNLFYKPNDSSKQTEAAGQRVPSPQAAPERPLLIGDPSSWYDTLDGLESVDYVYAQNRFFYDAAKLCLKVEDSAWSEAFPLGMQNEGMITIKDKDNSGRMYQFGVKVKPAPGSFWRTKLVRLFPGFMLVNKTSSPLRYRQQGHGPQYQLAPNQQLPFHWPKIEPVNEDESHKIMIGKAEKDTWSPAFAIDIAGGFQVRLSNAFSEAEDETLLNVIVKPMEGTTFIVFGEPSTASDPEPSADAKNSITVVSYQIQNRTKYGINIHQKNSTYTCTVEPNTTIPFCWDVPQIAEPLLQLRLSSEGNKVSPTELSLDVIAKTHELPMHVAQDGTRLKMEVTAQGPRKVLIITDGGSVPSKDSKQNEVKQADGKKSPDAPVALDAGSEMSEEKVVSMNFKVSLKGVGVSVIDSTPQELLYFTLQTIFAGVQVSNLDQEVEVKIGMAQLDNQLYLSPLPIVLYSTPQPDKPFFHASLVRDPNVPAVQFFRYFALQLQEIDLAIHEVFLYRLLSFTKFVTDYLYAKSEEEVLQKLLAQTDSEIPKIKDDELSSSDMYYFELFQLNPIKVLVTFMTSIDLDAAAAKEETEADDAQSGLAEILGYVGVLTDIERAPIELNALILPNPFCSRNDLMNRIMKHYTLAGLKQAYKIVGSADFLGNPVSLVSNLGTGVKDFFFEPAMGIVESPAAFGKGLAKGTKSLLLKTTYAIFDSTSKITGAVAKVGAKLTMDDDYQRERAIRNQTKARHAGEGLVYGARDFGIGIYKGITGVVLEPIKGGQEEGAVGVFKGIGKGLAGVVLKPVVGVVDLVSRTTEGIKNTTTFMDEQQKAPVRPPRYIGADGLVRSYDYEKAAGQLVLRTLSERRGRRDIYESHVLINKDLLIILSRRHILCLQQDKLHFGHKWELAWKEKLSSIAAAIVTIPPPDVARVAPKPDEKPFLGVVLAVDPINAEPRSHKIVCDKAKQAGSIGSRLASLGVTVKKATSLQQIITSAPQKLAKAATPSSPEGYTRLPNEEPLASSSTALENFDNVTMPVVPPSPASTSTSDQADSSQGVVKAQQDSDEFALKFSNQKKDRFAGLADWGAESEDEFSGNESMQYGDDRKKRKGKKKANEKSKLLGGDDDEKNEGCCSCSCTIQ